MKRQSLIHHTGKIAPLQVVVLYGSLKTCLAPP